MKTIRFKEVVRRCGAPSVHLQFGPPEKDAILQRAVKAGRVMTIHQSLHGGKKDCGSVGFFHERHAQILIFPKSLRRLGEARVVGVDFELVAKSRVTYRTPPPRVPVRRPPPIPPSETPQDPPEKSAEPELAESALEANEDAPSEEQAPPTPPPKTTSRLPALPPEVSAEIKKVLRQLKAGKTVAAYERLAALVKSRADSD